MEWIVKIENQPNQRIVVRFEPEAELLIFVGQYKPQNKVAETPTSMPVYTKWVDFSHEEYSMEIDAETIQRLLLKVYETMKARLKAYDNIAEGFTLIKKIEIQTLEEEI